MTAEEPSPSVDLSRIASIEGKIRHICDLIPISTWGFTAEVNKKLRERKHRIVNQQLTTKEKQKLTKNKKQQVARSVGGICNKVSEVIDLLSTSHGRDTKVKKSVDPSTKPKIEDRKKQTEKKEKRKEKPVQCEAKDRALDIMEQREQAIRKLQEKLKAMRETRQGKKKAGGDPSKALAFEKERKLKRRMSKIKLKSRIAQQKLSKTDGSKQELRKAKMDEDLSKEDGSAVTFSKFDFLVKNNKKKRLSTSEKKQKFTGKDYKSLINKVEKREEKLEKLREKEPEKAAELEHDIKWKRALNKAQGIKMKDNMELLKKGMKRKEKMKEKRKENWSNRRSNVEKEKAKRQEKREENIGKRINDKKKKKLQTMRKKGRVL
nr:Surfeit locus 6 domain containing protein [Haemonchus contortus]